MSPYDRYTGKQFIYELSGDDFAEITLSPIYMKDQFWYSRNNDLSGDNLFFFYLLDVFHMIT